ncbi:TetR/AcrR family transcriptional regulator [Fodinicola feengrottensis]|uniref:TetR/AcrR family transcriptional regulator n=2 Tax=Fodinicola feengrottensis TaxID=435914 RepID=A0ABN2IYZ8_9ACTN|nr:TetR/AcrR family transcriptional regulator [Fodinicola feengrottensis]
MFGTLAVMGNREDLLEGAKRCLYEKGYARTTARDIATAAGTSLAAIGYHYKTTEALLNQALIEVMGDFGDKLAAALSPDNPDAGTLEKFEAMWTGVLNSFKEDRAVYAASLEIFGQMDRVAEAKQAFADGIDETRFWWAKTLHGTDPGDEKTARILGSFYQALMSGVIVQWLIDPERAPSAQDLATALRLVGAQTR